MFDTESQAYTIIKKYKIELVFIGISLLIPVVAIFILTSNIANASQPEIEFKSNKTIVPTNKIFVDISGAIMNPDVYELPEGSRLNDLLMAAGGLSTNADESYVAKNFNKARILTDQDKIYIPSVNEVATGKVSAFQQTGEVNSQSIDTSTKLISINEASTKDLESLPGIGETTANKIADNRPYTSIDELMSKKVVSTSVFAKIKALITL